MLGLSWQYTYNSIHIWKKDSILFKVREKKVFESFLGKERYFDATYSKDGDLEVEEPIKRDNKVAKSVLPNARTKKLYNSSLQELP